jgi:hypothetical protein
VPSRPPVGNWPSRINMASFASWENEVVALAVREARSPHIQRGPGWLCQWHGPPASRFRLGLTYYQHLLSQVNICPAQLPDFGMSQASVQAQHGHSVDWTSMTLLRARF